MNRFVKYFLIPLFLFSIWFTLIIYQSFQIENVLSVLTQEYTRENLIEYKSGEIYQKDKIKGQFIASYDYLGIIGFRFWTFYRLNDDDIIFRVKEVGSNKFHYETRYRVDQFQPNQYFTFGFPAIANSKGKTYEFELESTQGRPGVAVSASQINPLFIVKYKYPKELITSSTLNLVSFSFLKVSNLSQKSEFEASSYIYFLPLILYLFTITKIYEKFAKFTFIVLITSSNFNEFLIRKILNVASKSNIAISILLLGVILDIFFVTKGDLTVIILIILFLVVTFTQKIPAVIFFILANVTLFFSMVTYYFSSNLIAERAAAWVWIFLTLSLLVLTLPKSKNKLILGNIINKSRNNINHYFN